MHTRLNYQFLPTTYAVQFYMLMSGSEKPISFTIEQFKEWLGIAPEAYKNKDGKDAQYNKETIRDRKEQPER